QKFGLFETWDETEDTALFWVGHLGLTAYHVVASSMDVFRAKLDNRVGTLPGHRMLQSHRLQWSKLHGLPTSLCHHLNRNAVLKVGNLFKFFWLDLLCLQHRFVQGIVG